MATFVTADIHGEYEKFKRLLQKIEFKDTDTLYILGDIFDRGPHPILTMISILDMPNVHCLIGNHELMALECMEFLLQEITDESIEMLDDKMFGNLMTWYHNGAGTTIKEMQMFDSDGRRTILDSIKEFSVFEELSIGDKDYLLVHAGLGNYRPDKDMDEYSLKELVWNRADYDIQYFPDKYVITGHTPTQLIKENPNPGYIFRHNNHIAIDCGACFPGGRLAAICLDTDEEHYIESVE